MFPRSEAGTGSALVISGSAEPQSRGLIPPAHSGQPRDRHRRRDRDADLDYASNFPALGGSPEEDDDSAQVTVLSNSIAGLIHVDLNNNGIYEPGSGETLIASSITLELTGTDHVGNQILRDGRDNNDNGKLRFCGIGPHPLEGRARALVPSFSFLHPASDGHRHPSHETPGKRGLITGRE